jgi:hypothetical protein
LQSSREFWIIANNLLPNSLRVAALYRQSWHPTAVNQLSEPALVRSSPQSRCFPNIS